MNKVHTPGIQVLRQSNGMVQHEYEPGQYEIIPMDAPWRFEQQLDDGGWEEPILGG